MERLPLATARFGASVRFIALALATVWTTCMNSCELLKVPAVITQVPLMLSELCVCG